MKNKKIPGNKPQGMQNITGKCSLCNKNILSKDITFLEQDGQKSVFHVICAACGNSFIFFAANNQNSLVSLAVATDLDKQEVKNIFKKESISTDEIIDVHQLMLEDEGLIKLVNNF